MATSAISILIRNQHTTQGSTWRVWKWRGWSLWPLTAACVVCCQLEGHTISFATKMYCVRISPQILTKDLRLHPEADAILDTLLRPPDSSKWLTVSKKTG